MKRLQALIGVITLGVAYAAQAEGGAIPQMDFASFPNQMLWLAICFALFYAVVSRVIIPSVGGVLAVRQTTIAEAIAKAEAFKKTAGEAHTDLESRNQQVHTQVAAITAEAQANAAKMTAERVAKLNGELEAKEAQANARLTQALTAAAGDMQAATAEVARSIAEKLLGATVDASTVAAALKKAA